MTPTRRTFLIGLGATVAATTAAKAFYLAGEPAGSVCLVNLDKRFKYRAMCDFVFSSMGDTPTDASVTYDFMRNETTFFKVQMNSRATYRWVTVPDGEIVFTGKDLLSIRVDPCQDNFTLTIMSQIEQSKSPLERKKYFTESFHWKHGKLVTSDIAACSHLDEHLLA